MFVQRRNDLGPESFHGTGSLVTSRVIANRGQHLDVRVRRPRGADRPQQLGPQVPFAEREMLDDQDVRPDSTEFSLEHSLPFGKYLRDRPGGIHRQKPLGRPIDGRQLDESHGIIDAGAGYGPSSHHKVDIVTTGESPDDFPAAYVVAHAAEVLTVHDNAFSGSLIAYIPAVD